MQIRREGDNVPTVTATSQELSALVAAARIGARRGAQRARAAALELVERVIADYDKARERLG